MTLVNQRDKAKLTLNFSPFWLLLKLLQLVSDRKAISTKSLLMAAQILNVFIVEPINYLLQAISSVLTTINMTAIIKTYHLLTLIFSRNKNI